MSQRKTILSFFIAAQLTLILPAWGRSDKKELRKNHPGWLQYVSSEEAGWSRERLEKARQKADSMGSTSVMVIFRGHVLATWGEVNRRCACHSVRKSLITTLIGIQATEGNIDLNRTIADLHIDDLQSLTEAEGQATIRDLLASRSGIYHTAAKETKEMKRLRPIRGSHEAGTFWYYNNWDFNVLGVILEQEAKLKIAEEFQKRLAMPLEMEDFRLHDMFYQNERSLSRHPAYTFRLSARDLARFGQMVLQGGTWKEKEIVDRKWIEEAWRLKSQVRKGTFFGYTWWIYPRENKPKRSEYPNLYLYDRYATWGIGGQVLLVIPDAEIVFVHLADTDTGAFVSGKKIWELMEMILAARSGTRSLDPKLAPMAATPFKNVKPAASEHKAISLEKKILRDLVGDFELGQKRIIRLRLGEGILIGTIDQRELDFFPGAKTYFFSRAENIQIVFNKDKSGHVSGLTLIERGKSQRAKKKDHQG